MRGLVLFCVKTKTQSRRFVFSLLLLSWVFYQLMDGGHTKQFSHKSVPKLLRFVNKTVSFLEKWSADNKAKDEVYNQRYKTKEKEDNKE